MSDWCDFTDLKLSLRAMADVVRLNILHQLAGQGEITVTDLVSALAISQPLVSWHLRILRRAGLVSTRRQGREVLCSLDMARFVACQRALTDVVAAGTPRAPDAPHAPPPLPNARTAVGTLGPSRPNAPEGTAHRSRTPAGSAEP
jgi:ArsR family transcriptional regulator